MTFTPRFRAFATVFSLALALGVGTMPVLALDLKGALGGGLDKAVPAELKGSGDINVIIGNLISSAIGLLGVVLLVYLLYGGFLYMTAGGDAGQVKSAIAIIRNAIIGLVIIASAYAIANFVITALGNATSGVQSGDNPPPPPPP